MGVKIVRLMSMRTDDVLWCFFFFQAEDGIRDLTVTGVQTCALPIYLQVRGRRRLGIQADELRLREEATVGVVLGRLERSEEHTSELQSQSNLVCRLLLEKKKNYEERMSLQHEQPIVFDHIILYGNIY